jgi:Tol biopolymer transport system component
LTQEVIPSWSRDGQWIYYASDRGGEMRVFKSAFRLQGGAGEAVVVTKRAGWTHQESPDGKYLYFAPQFADGLWRVPVGGGEERLVPVPMTRRDNRFWEVVEKGIYFASGAESQKPVVQFYDFATGKATPVFTAEKPLVFGYGGLSISPDGRYILFSQIDQSGSDIVLLDYAR